MTAELAHGVAPSPFRDHLGLSIVELVAGRAVLELEVAPPLMNYVGRLNGGVVASMVDMAGTLAGAYVEGAPPRSAVTLAFTVAFLGTAAAGRVRAVGTVRGGGRNIYNSGVDVFDAAGALIAVGQGTYRYISEGRST